MRFKYKALAQYISLVVLDLAAFYISLLLAIFSQRNFKYLMNFKYIFGSENFSAFVFLFSYTVSILWIPLAYIIVLQFEKLYNARYPFWDESRIIFKSVTIAIVFIFLTITIRNMYGNISRTVFLYLWAYLIFALPIVRYWGKKFLFKTGVWKESVLIIGAGEKAVATINGLYNEEHLGYNVVGFLDDNPKNIGKTIRINDKEYKVYGPIKNYEKFIHLLNIETVFIANPSVSQEELTRIVNDVYKLVKRVIIIPDINGVAIFNSELQYLFMEKLFMIKVNNNLNSTANRIVKRGFDITTSILLFIFISPVFLFIALLIKITSKGTVIFRQPRIGKDGMEFYAYKFRTMYMDAQERLKNILETDPAAKREWDKNFKIKNDPRVTSIGKFLRKTSLDELPQIFNIMRGEMSAVGPRPVIQEEIEKYYGSYRHYYYSVLPGMTGLWQVSGRSDTGYDFRIQTDVWYVQNWSLWLDIIIIFKSIPAVLNRKGAY